MSRYFFHVQDGSFTPDEVGTEFTDDAEARKEAVRAAGEMLMDIPGVFWDSGRWTMTVVDQDGRQICQLEFSGKADS